MVTFIGNNMKTCTWCLTPCDKYRKNIRNACGDMLSWEATAYREQCAEHCDRYVTHDDDYITDTIQINATPEIMQESTCSINIFAQSNPPCKRAVAGISTCHECGKPMCPICHRHNVTQLSRVTGYVGDIAEWNEGKKQELKDRKKYNIRGKDT